MVFQRIFKLTNHDVSKIFKLTNHILQVTNIYNHTQQVKNASN